MSADISDRLLAIWQDHFPGAELPLGFRFAAAPLASCTGMVTSWPEPPMGVSIAGSSGGLRRARWTIPVSEALNLVKQSLQEPPSSSTHSMPAGTGGRGAADGRGGPFSRMSGPS